MHYTDHQSLIDELSSKVKSGPPVFGGKLSEHYKDCWIIIKQIGPAFKAVRYPTWQDKQRAWENFNNAVAQLKIEQAQYNEEREEKSRPIRKALLALADASSPETYNLIDLLSDRASEFVCGMVDVGIWAVSLGFIKPDPFDPERDRLRILSENYKKAWQKFKEEQKHLVREHHQEVYARLVEVGEELDKAWSDFKQQSEVQYEERQRRREAWREGQEAFLGKLERRLENQQEYLERKQEQLAELEKKRDDAWSDDFRERVEKWIEECADKISEVENDIRGIEAKIEEVKAGLDHGRAA